MIMFIIDRYISGPCLLIAFLFLAYITLCGFRHTNNSHTHIIALTETPSGSHLLYVLGAVGPCSAVFGLRAGGLRRPRWTPDVDLIRELTGQSVPYCKSTTYNQQHKGAAPPKKTPSLKIAET